ncbi:MAG: WYL domain-containing protein [Syntrophomonadaceae bacterium]|nr:WYL domain-containing protein [Syntrophomonadaceae bacterium]
MASGQVSNITAMATNIYRCIEKRPNIEVEIILAELNITRLSLYNYLIAFKEEVAIYDEGVFKVCDNGKNLTLDKVETYLQKELPVSNKPSKVERILYLYHLLYANIPYGGVSFDDIMHQYITLLEHSSASLPKEKSISRTIYRDIEELEKIGIIIDRPSTGNKKYCLRYNYLPKLSFDQASFLYVSMLLFEDTILDRVSSSALAEFEKAFFKNSPNVSENITTRIHVVGDTLANPAKFSERFTKLIAAVVNSYQIKITYIKLNREISERFLQPVGLVFKRGVWYLVANNIDNNEYRIFRTDQIMEVTLRNIQFEYPEDFSLENYIGDSWGVFTNDKVEEVILRFSPRVSTRVKNLQYHRSQKLLEELPDGSVIIGLEVCGLIELKSWLLQWGNEVMILEPKYLGEELAIMAQEIVKLYKK